MENYDPAMAARVWQRVRSTDPFTPEGPGLLEMIAEERMDAATYLHLSRRYQGKDSAALRRMYEEEQSHTACLKGIYTLMTGSRPAAQLPKPPQEPLEVTLRRCYDREARCIAQYEALSSDTQYGQVYARLASQEREHCRILLELLGKSKPKR